MKKYAVYFLYPVAIICICTMIGWTLDIEFFKRPFGELVAMNPMTASGLILIILALQLYFKKPADSLWTDIGSICAVMVTTIGAAKLFTLFNVDFGIDRSLFRGEILSENATGQINRMAINTAFCFLLCGVAILLLRSGKKAVQNITDYITLLIFIVGLFSFIGYIYRVREYYYIFSHIPMSIQTAICFICIAMGLLTYHSDRGFMRVITSDYIGGKVAFRLIPVVIFIPILFGYVRLYLLSWVMVYSVELGVAVLITSIITAFLIVLWYLANALNQTDEVRKATEEKIARQADLFKLIPDAVVYTTKDLTITGMNSAAELMFETTAAVATGRKIDDITIIEMMGDMSRQAARSELWGDKGFWRGECLLTMPSGNKFNFLTTLQTIKNEHGVNVGLVCLYTDTTPLHVNEQLQKALSKEEDNNKYLQQLTYISTHDLKAPIVAASELIKVLIKAKAVKEGYEEVLDMTSNTVDQMKRTNQALNEILKIRTNLNSKKELDGGLMPLRTIIDDVKDTIHKNIAEKNGQLTIEINDMGETKFPYLHTKSILYNLMSNAIKYADPKRAPEVTLLVKNNGNGGAVISIQDNGLGINLEAHGDKLFTAFKRFHSHVEGSGVGLHIVKSLVDQYEGEIDVKSAVGQGTTFVINFNNAIIDSWN